MPPYSGLLVDVQTKPVTGPMSERLAQPVLLQDIPRGGIYGRRVNSGANSRNRSLLSGINGSVDATGFW
jgi:hypothetical protein